MSDFKYPEARDSKWTDLDCNSDLKNKDAKQSPVNIDTNSLQECHTLCKLEMNYLPNTCKIKKTKQNLFRINYNNGSYIKFDNFNYELKYIQFHTPGMHTIDYKESEMEIILYHSNYENHELIEQKNDDEHKKKFMDNKFKKRKSFTYSR